LEVEYRLLQDVATRSTEITSSTSVASVVQLSACLRACAESPNLCFKVSSRTNLSKLLLLCSVRVIWKFPL